MNVYPLLQEMPQETESIDWHKINDPEENRQLYLNFSANKYKKHILPVFADANIYQLGSQIFCLDAKMKRVTYYLKYAVGNNGKIGSYIWQSIVWVHPVAGYLSGIPQQTFFRNLLPKFGTIITDSQHTWDGKRFWRLRIAEAFQQKLNVYFYNFANHEIVELKNYEEFEYYDKIKDIWGPSDKHQMKRIIISNKELSLK